MQCRIRDLRCKEVINICDGCRIGYINDAEIDMITGKVCALIVPGPCRFFGLFGRDSDYVIPWQCVKRFGEDIVLVDIVLDQCRRPRSRKGW